nr:hypothetical protein [Tanacetum cinerariifolium]
SLPVIVVTLTAALAAIIPPPQIHRLHQPPSPLKRCVWFIAAPKKMFVYLIKPHNKGVWLLCFIDHEGLFVSFATAGPFGSVTDLDAFD